MSSEQERLARRFPLTADEEAYFSDAQGRLSVKIPEHYGSLIDPKDPSDPLRRQVIPTVAEHQEDERASFDPLEEERYSVTDRLIHRYSSTAAFLTTDRCVVHCRHCFRRRFTATDQGPATKEQIAAAASYIGAHPQITEVLFTGGDVLTLTDDALEAMIATFRSRRPDLVIRLCTRVPVASPERITEALLAMLKRHDTAPFYLMTQFNHPTEVSPAAIGAVGRFIDQGIVALNQSVLLQGVNDEVKTLVQLCKILVQHRIKPYYLFVGDLVQSTAHLRVPLRRSLALEEGMRQQLSGIAMPTLAVDLPHGGGKLPVNSVYLQGEVGPGVWRFATFDGSQYDYYDPPTR
ncbi:MAG TPA: KamA family radical SAM protein [Sphaerochaeta sp.]|nr:KamA family radical SAM protein [Sphaerochaeta sp.]